MRSEASDLVDRVAVRDGQTGKLAEQPVEEREPSLGDPKRRIPDEERNDALGVAMGRGQGRVVVKPQVTCEEDDGGVHRLPS